VTLLAVPFNPVASSSMAAVRARAKFAHSLVVADAFANRQRFSEPGMCRASRELPDDEADITKARQGCVRGTSTDGTVRIYRSWWQSGYRGQP
jgi:hypothetical protein